jgi:hypothetical protein
MVFPSSSISQPNHPTLALQHYPLPAGYSNSPAFKNIMQFAVLKKSSITAKINENEPGAAWFKIAAINF